MTIYWRLKNIPELRDVPPPRRRRLWGEAESRSFSVGALGLLLAVTFAFAVVFALFGHWLWQDSFRMFTYAVPGLALASVFNSYVLTQPRARRWLREHAHELDRYVPA